MYALRAVNSAPDRHSIYAAVTSVCPCIEVAAGSQETVFDSVAFQSI